MSEPLRNVKEAAAYLRISPKKLYALTAAREVECTRFGRAIRFTQDDLDAIVAQRKQPVIAPPSRLRSVGPRPALIGTHPPSGPSTPPPPSGPKVGRLPASALRRAG